MSDKQSIPKTLCECHISQLRCEWLKAGRCTQCSPSVKLAVNDCGNRKKHSECVFAGMRLCYGQPSVCPTGTRKRRAGA